jgi:rSAM/selenodomain-associated transferase 2
VRIAVVIPVLDEAERVSGAIASVGPWERGLPALSTGLGANSGPEILVVDGGSRDSSAARAGQAGARVVVTERGRARQLEAGWRASAGDVIVFLHADTRLGPGWQAALAEVMADPRVVGGAFRLRFDAPGLAFRLVEFIVWLRVWLFALPYGDQAIFVRRSVLEAMGGIPMAEVMEDLDLVRAMKRQGHVAALATRATTSSRRYLERGLWTTLFRNALALMAWRLGVDRVRIANWVGR